MSLRGWQIFKDECQSSIKVVINFREITKCSFLYETTRHIEFAIFQWYVRGNLLIFLVFLKVVLSRLFNQNLMGNESGGIISANMLWVVYLYSSMGVPKPGLLCLYIILQWNSFVQSLVYSIAIN